MKVDEKGIKVMGRKGISFSLECVSSRSIKEAVGKEEEGEKQVLSPPNPSPIGLPRVIIITPHLLFFCFTHYTRFPIFHPLGLICWPCFSADDNNNPVLPACLKRNKTVELLALGE